MNPPGVTNYSQSYPLTQKSCRGRVNNIFMGTVLKVKVCELEGKVGELFSRRMRKYLIIVV